MATFLSKLSRRRCSSPGQTPASSRLTVFLYSDYCALFLCLAMLTTAPGACLGDRLGVKCADNGAFFCYDADPTSFTRCIENELYLFHCPDGLHFSTLSQTCDWPENADCGKHGGFEGHKSAGINKVLSDGAKSAESPWGKVSSRTQDDGNGHSASASASGTMTLSGSGRPWWRPENVDPKSWEDIENLVEVPFDGSVSVSASVSGKKGGDSKSEDKSQKIEEKTPKSAGKSLDKGAGKEDKGAGKEDKGDHDRHDHQGPSLAEGSKVKGGHAQRPISETAEKRPDLANIQWHDGPCDPKECTLPNCRCPGTEVPGSLSPKQTPQMVMLTFDDEVSAAYYGYFQRLFRPGRYNPNGCPVRGCLFVSGSGTDLDLVYPLYAMGVEIASHTLSHKFPHTWWASASYQEYVDEVEGMRRTLASDAGVPYESIKGFRVPFLQLGGDNMYKALYDQKFVYDTSMFTGSVWEGSDPVWPFTLDYTVPEIFCQHDPCPKKQYPGLWEIPVQRWYGVDGHSCAMPDGCTPTADAEEDLEFFRSNFKRYYESNRAPLGIFVHARWFHTEHHLEALDRFIDELMSLEDVYIVTPIQVVEWMRNPTPLHGIKDFQPWTCEGSVDKTLGDRRRRR